MKETPINIHMDGVWMAIGCQVAGFNTAPPKKKEPAAPWFERVAIKSIAVSA
jgi:hypothetical protein